MVINIKKLNGNAIIPTRGSEQAAGYDLYACIDKKMEIASHETVKVPTGLAIKIPKEYFGAIFARSGLSSKKGLRPANCVGIIDADYTGECLVMLHNDTNNVQIIEPYDRIAQLVIMPFLTVSFFEVNELPKTKRGDEGFGSTGR